MLECKGCTFGELGARGVRLECTGGVRGARALGQARGRAGVRAGRVGVRGRARRQASGSRARGRAAARAATGVLFTQEHVLHPESLNDLK
ncbi:hypothetical protein CRG98_012043 [Punica granatum]|uniref:Uncharacterized protein n=1 Tax=Punica granatum TaxID=22663 RepID=A0A2I0KG39_PUNGR|nr:hypothetical protein CRG98_012043 [Punica granatum]